MAAFQTRRFGKYLLLEKLATGGMAQLYRAKIIGVQGFERFIAIKMILPHLAEEKVLVDSFIDEAKLAALLNHQNIVQIYDFGELEGSNFITMEYLFGKDLRAILAKSRELAQPLGLEYALFMTAKICAGLEYAHTLKDFQGQSLKIIHRDISPQNVIVTYEGEVKIVDFGIAKAASQSTATQVGMIKGKVAYMSPEQADGKPLDHRSDIFSLGILLYELVTGNRLFKGEDTLQILARVREADFDSPEFVTGGFVPKLNSILTRALSKDVDARYQSCTEMQADIEECIYEQGLRPSARGLAQYMKALFSREIAAEETFMREASGGAAPDETVRFRKETEPPPSAPETTGPPPVESGGTPSNRRALIAAAAAAVLLLAAGGVFLTRGKSGGAPPKVAANENPAPVPPAPAPQPPVDRAAKAGSLVATATGLIETDPAKAREMLLEAVRIDPSNPDSFFNLGFVYASRKEYAKAAEMYENAVALSPKYLDEALFNLAMVQEKQGKKAESATNLEKALKANPNNAMAKKFLRKTKKGANG